MSENNLTYCDENAVAVEVIKKALKGLVGGVLFTPVMILSGIFAVRILISPG